MESFFDIPKWVLFPTLVVLIYIFMLLGRDDSEKNKNKERKSGGKQPEQKGSEKSRQELNKNTVTGTELDTNGDTQLDAMIKDTINTTEQGLSPSAEEYRKKALDRFTKDLDQHISDSFEDS